MSFSHQLMPHFTTVTTYLAVFVTPRTVVRDSDPPNTLLGCSAIDAPHLLSHATINMPVNKWES